MSDDARGVRARLFVDGQLVSERWLSIDGTSFGDVAAVARTIGDEQAAIAQQAAADGKLWLAEIYDPGLPDDSAYMRLGTDRNGMIAPYPIGAGS